MAVVLGVAQTWITNQFYEFQFTHIFMEGSSKMLYVRSYIFLELSLPVHLSILVWNVGTYKLLDTKYSWYAHIFFGLWI